MLGERSLTGKQWRMHEVLLSADSPDELLTGLAERRGIADILQGGKQTLSSPWDFPEMHKAVERILKAMERNERIVIFGDYDADGITAAAQLQRFFIRHVGFSDVLLPHRSKHGYGLKKEFIDTALEQGATLLITVDTGITAQMEIEYAASKKIDTIVTDHHHVRSGRPPAFAVIHPFLAENFPNPYLSGSGVAFMLVRALEETLGNKDAWDGFTEDLLLAAIGTVADAVPLIGENRTLVQSGLKHSMSLPDGAIKTFVTAGMRSQDPLTSGDIGFRIAPLINACGRMDDPMIALDALLLGKSEVIEQVLALNAERRALTGDLLLDAERELADTQGFIVVQNADYPVGLVGLIAGRLSDRLGKPSLIAAIVEGKAVASLRSIPEVDLMAILTHPEVSSLLQSFGGHAQAAGCSFDPKHIDLLRERLNERLTAMQLNAETLSPRLLIDAELPSSFLNLNFCEMLERFEPFGKHNEEPRFVLRDQKIENVRMVGATQAHLSCRINGNKAIGFHLGMHAAALAPDARYDIVCRVSRETWNNRTAVQLFIEDIALCAVQTGTSPPSTWKTSVTSV